MHMSKSVLEMLGERPLFSSNIRDLQLDEDTWTKGRLGIIFYTTRLPFGISQSCSQSDGSNKLEPSLLDGDREDWLTSNLSLQLSDITSVALEHAFEQHGLALSQLVPSCESESALRRSQVMRCHFR